MTTRSEAASTMQGSDGAAWKASSRRAWLIWVVVVFIAAVMLFCSGEAALLLPERIPIADTRARIKADYGVWPQQIAPPVNVALLEEIRRDTPGLPTQLIVSENGSGKPPDGGAPPVLATQTPSPTETLQPVIYVLPSTTPPRPVSSPVFPPTATREVRLPTAVPTRVNPPVLPQREPTNTPTRTLKPNRRTNTPDPPRPTRTSTPTFTSTPSHTPTPSNTPTATLRPPTLTYTPTTVIPSPTPTVFWAVDPPDGISQEIPCGERHIIDLHEPRQIESLVYFEYYHPFDCSPSGNNCTPGIRLDQMEIFLSVTGNPGDEVSVFRWGDTSEENNGLIWSDRYQDSNGERDNEYIPSTELFQPESIQQPRTGVCIPVDLPMRFRYIVVFSPVTSPAADCYNDPAQIDAIGVNFDLARCPAP